MSRSVDLVARNTGVARAKGYRPAEASLLGTGWEGPALLGITLGLLSFGLAAIYSASAVLAQTSGYADYHFIVRQAIGGVAGIVVLVAAAQVDYHRYRRWAWPLLAVSVLLLMIIVLPWTEAISPASNGARRWLRLGPITVQPSELTKLTLILWTAMLAVKKQARLSSLSRGLMPFLVIWALVELLIFLQPDLSGAVLVLLLSALVVFAAGGRIGHFLFLGIVGVPILWSQVESVAYRMRRMVAFLDPSKDPAGVSYQINQALIAFGSGGVFGEGFGRGQQKFGFLPEPHNDFIFAMIGEEWGLLGAFGIISLFIAFALVGYRIARQAPDLFGFLVAIGLTNLVVVQAMLHMAVNTALVPTTGVTLPFISYGRSSLLVCMAAVGILMNIARAGAAEARTAGGAP